MIVDPTSSYSSMANTNEFDEQAPPSYDTAVGDRSEPQGPFVPESSHKGRDIKVNPFPPSLPNPAPYDGHPGPSRTVVYNYVNPRTGERVVSLLPPDHPQMVCLQEGGHVPATKYGLLGVLAAVFWFPLGIGLCLLDRKVYCKRCGMSIDEGLC
ncbi:uncharacterized protein BXZ73DRAFT_102028 [Epithele typhae]|uniref:uncharacterized protein n=1 Tax=Epithele typhae TaxID=378194 RepID=UPI0020073C0A|nr:uncharacterized protein BXZ73DRAFT_102028 [Epithele typhae]KAH9929498.1 hypothetical protein BXZ73DRAFT_102028 [Epithele typhae]